MRSIFLFLFFLLAANILTAQTPSGNDFPLTTDSLSVAFDSLPVADDSLFQKKNRGWEYLLDSNYLLSAYRETPGAYAAAPRQNHGREFDFYFLVFLFGAAGTLRAIYPRYFANMFRVFFNTSLRQGQLTDQLLQAKLTSLLFNVFFLISTGFFIYQVLKAYEMVTPGNHYRLLLLITGGLTLVYSGKFLVVKFAGWISGYNREAESYIFVIFLVNKIMGLVLLPLTTLITFSQENISRAAVILSLIAVAMLFLLRFFRSYGILQHRMQLNRFHFFLYILSVEVLPILVLYKLGKDVFMNYS